MATSIISVLPPISSLLSCQKPNTCPVPKTPANSNREITIKRGFFNGHNFCPTPISLFLNLLLPTGSFIPSNPRGQMPTQSRQWVHPSTVSTTCFPGSTFSGHALLQRLQLMQTASSRTSLTRLKQLRILTKAPMGHRYLHHRRLINREPIKVTPRIIKEAFKAA